MTSKKPGDWRVRGPPPKDCERPDQYNVSYIQLNAEVLMDLKLVDGHVCKIWKIDEPRTTYEAIAKVSVQRPSINYDVAVMFETFRKRCHIELKDRICIAAAEGFPEDAKSLILKDISLGDSRDPLHLTERDYPVWEWCLEKQLRRAGHVFTGLKVSANPDRQKGLFEVMMVNGKSNKLAYFNPDSSPTVRISRDSGSAEPSSTPPLKVVGVAGIDEALEKLNKQLRLFEKRPRVSETGRGILLCGAPGTGKTMLMDQIRHLGWGKTFQIDKTIKTSQLRDIFTEAKKQPSIIFMDNLDSLVTKEDSRTVTLGIEEAIAAEMDNIGIHRILCIASTSKPNDISKCLTDLGRFNKHIHLPIPTATSRKQIMRSLQEESVLSNEIIERLGDRTHAYVGRDLKHLLCEAADFSWHRMDEDSSLESHAILQEDIDKALHVVRPSAMRDVFLETTKIRWDEIGGQDEVKRELRKVVERQNPSPAMKASLQRNGIDRPKGLLLYGPPGCSKTLSAQAVATEASLNFFAVKGAELLNMYVGESERQIRDLFAKARAASPAIIFFDEIEAIASKREAGRGQNGVNTLTTLLNEMDGVEALRDVTVIAATNQPESLDLALLRPGRFDRLLYVAPPDLAGRQAILSIQRKKRENMEGVDVDEIARLTDGYSGAELVAICNKAAELAHESFVEEGVVRRIEKADFERVVAGTKRQISKEVIARYKAWASGTGASLVDRDD